MTDSKIADMIARFVLVWMPDSRMAVRIQIEELVELTRDLDDCISALDEVGLNTSRFDRRRARIVRELRELSISNQQPQRGKIIWFWEIGKIFQAIGMLKFELLSYQDVVLELSEVRELENSLISYPMKVEPGPSKDRVCEKLDPLIDLAGNPDKGRAESSRAIEEVMRLLNENNLLAAKRTLHEAKLFSDRWSLILKLLRMKVLVVSPMASV